MSIPDAHPRRVRDYAVKPVRKQAGSALADHPAVWLRTSLLLLLASALCTREAAAQRASAAATAAPSASGEIRTGATFYENFFQDSNAGARRDIWAGQLEVRLENPIGASEQLRAYTRIEFLQFHDLGSSPGVIAGLKRSGRWQFFDVSGGMQWNRPRSDVGEELEQADLLGGTASYTLRIPGLQFNGQALYREEFLRPERITGSRFHEYGGGIALRPFRGRVMPEVGYLRGVRVTENAYDEYMQETRYAGLRISAIPRVYVSARYRKRRREYTIADIASTNYGREDRRDNVSASVDVTLSRRISVSVSGGIEEGTSSRPGRDFVARYAGTGFVLRY